MPELTAIELSERLTHVALSGRLDAAGAQAIDLKLTSHTAARRLPLIVELSAVEFIASLGVGVLIAAARALRAHGAAMVLLAPRERVAETLRRSRIDAVITIVETREDAFRLHEIDS